ncbi:MAG: ribonuclease H family protein [Bacteroidota bacterium]
MAKKQKFYVVWVGHRPGIYTDWPTAKAQIDGFAGARYKSFPSRSQAEAAYRSGTISYGSPTAPERGGRSKTPRAASSQKIIRRSISVDAACSGNPGPMEYQGVMTANQRQIFHQAFPLGTNNIGEFLALVHGLAFLQAQDAPDLPIYSDSRIAIGWVRKGRAKTTLKRDARTQLLFEYLDRAEAWLKQNKITNPILKWETERWGEIPADFGRK